MRHEDGGHLHTAVVWLVTQGRKGTSWLDASYRGKSLSREIYARGVWDKRPNFSRTDRHADKLRNWSGDDFELVS